MAENSKIEWTDHTFNPWIGCTKVSPGCTNCYAAVDTFARRERSHGRELWGPRAERHRTSAVYWVKPLSWNKQKWFECSACGWRGPEKEMILSGCGNEKCPKAECCFPTRQRVFCSSLADVFEDRDELVPWRTDLFDLILKTPELDWLILTKRPENILKEAPLLWRDGFPPNIWIGTSVENQKTADERLPYLVNIPARVRFLSCEPLLGEVKLQHDYDGALVRNWLRPKGINWVICGGESGPHARPMHPDWARSLRDQCQAAGVPFFFKQWGEWKPVAELYSDDGSDLAFEHMDHWVAQMEPNGAIPVMSKFTEEGWCEYQPCPGSWFMAKVGKKEAGRLLDGREWNEVARWAR